MPKLGSRPNPVTVNSMIDGEIRSCLIQPSINFFMMMDIHRKALAILQPKLRHHPPCHLPFHHAEGFPVRATPYSI